MYASERDSGVVSSGKHDPSMNASIAPSILKARAWGLPLAELCVAPSLDRPLASKPAGGRPPLLCRGWP
jgi:hypothetical protein